MTVARLLRSGDSTSPPTDLLWLWWQTAAEIHVADGDPAYLLKLLRGRFEIPPEARELLAKIVKNGPQRKHGDHSKKLNVVQRRDIRGKLEAARIVRRESLKTLVPQAEQLRCEPQELRAYIDARLRRRVQQLATEYDVSTSTIEGIGKRRPKKPVR